MKGLMICILATVEVLGVIYAISRRSHLEASAGHARYTRYICSHDGEPKLVESNGRTFDGEEEARPPFGTLLDKLENAIVARDPRALGWARMVRERMGEA